MLEATMFVTTKCEFPEENQVSLLLVHKEKVP